MPDFLNPYLSGAVGALILSAAVRALPKPSPTTNTFYAWFYAFTHAVLANFDKVQLRGTEVKSDASHN